MNRMRRAVCRGRGIGPRDGDLDSVCASLFARDVGKFRQIGGLSQTAQALAARHLELWTDPKLKAQELDRMRHSNAEWDFMGRTFLVWSLADMSLRNPASKPDYLRVMDQIIDETLRLEKERDIIFS